MATGTVKSFPQKGIAESTRTDHDQNLQEKIKSRRTNELIIGVCGAVGCNLQDVVSELKDQFGAFSYEVTIVKVSSLIKELAKKHSDLSSIDIGSIENLDFFRAIPHSKILVMISVTNLLMTHWLSRLLNSSLLIAK